MTATFAKNIFTAFILVTSLAACKTLAPDISMPAGVAVPAPTAFQDLCARAPEECILPLNEQTRGLLTDLMLEVHSLVIPTAEDGDLWQTVSTPSAGDCEDFALTLRKKLREHLPQYGGAFLMATAYTEQAQYHAVLTIETTSGTIVCDIRYKRCGRWDYFPYEWHLREVAGQRHWEDIGNHQALAEMRAASIRRSSGR